MGKLLVTDYTFPVLGLFSPNYQVCQIIGSGIIGILLQLLSYSCCSMFKSGPCEG